MYVFDYKNSQEMQEPTLYRTVFSTELLAVRTATSVSCLADQSSWYDRSGTPSISISMMHGLSQNLPRAAKLASVLNDRDSNAFQCPSVLILFARGLFSSPKDSCM